MFGFGIAIAIGGGILLLVALLNDWETIVKTFLVIAACAAIGLGIWMSITGANTESFKRWQKDLESEFDGGLSRHIEIVDKDGKVIRSYDGQIDIQENDGEKIVFVMDGKKVIVYNTSIFNTVFVEEK